MVLRTRRFVPWTPSPGLGSARRRSRPSCGTGAAHRWGGLSTYLPNSEPPTGGLSTNRPLPRLGRTTGACRRPAAPTCMTPSALGADPGRVVRRLVPDADVGLD